MIIKFNRNELYIKNSKQYIKYLLLILELSCDVIWNKKIEFEKRAVFSL